MFVGHTLLFSDNTTICIHKILTRWQVKEETEQLVDVIYTYLRLISFL